MRDAVRTIAEKRYRETGGRYYEEFSVGDVYEHRPGRTISETDNTWFALLTMNTHPIHFDSEYAAHSEFGRILVASPLTLSIVVGMSVSDVSQKAKANLGWKEIKLTAPVFCGDTLYAESEVLEKRESASRSGDGIVTVRTLGKNQGGTVVCDFVRTILVPKRGHGVDDAANY
ncbi:MaoC family dehydratase [Leptospira interrogans]